MSPRLPGKVAFVAAGGSGIGRATAMRFAREGASVAVNSLHTASTQAVVDEITAAGGAAVANTDDISTWAGAERLISQAVEVFGGLDVVVNNAGILRDRMLVNMSEEEWDAVIQVHLKGTFAPSRHAAAYWRNRAKAGEGNDARIINTSSVSGIYGNPGQTNYGAAKAGIAGFTIIAARELARYGVTVNAIAPGALTRLTEDLGLSEDMTANWDPKWVAPVCVWLASTQSAGVTERVFEVSGHLLAVSEGWHQGPSAEPVADPREMDAVMRNLLADARSNATMQDRG